MSTTIVAHVFVDPADPPKVRMPTERDAAACTRPAVRLGSAEGRAVIGAEWHGDDDAATWWRSLAAAAETVAQWYDENDARSGGTGGE